MKRMTWTGRSARAAATLLVCAGTAASCGMLAGCSASVSDPPAHPSEDRSAMDVPFAYSTNDEPGGDSAQLIGTIENRDDCVIVVTDDGRTIIPVFPRSRVSIDGSTLKLDLATIPGGEAGFGQQIELGGGLAPSADGVVPAACPDDAEFFHVANL